MSALSNAVAEVADVPGGLCDSFINLEYPEALFPGKHGKEPSSCPFAMMEASPLRPPCISKVSSNQACTLSCNVHMTAIRGMPLPALDWLVGVLYSLTNDRDSSVHNCGDTGYYAYSLTTSTDTNATSE